MESEQRGGAPAVAPEEDVVWSRAWEWPAWMRPALPARRGWRPGAGTLAVLLLVVFVPPVIGGLFDLGTDLSWARGVPPGALEPDTFGAVPSWVQLFYASQVVLSFAGLVIVTGALALLLWRRLGAALLALGALVEAGAHVATLVAYVRSHQAPAGSIAQGVAEIVSRLVLLGLAVLLLLPRREPALPPVEASFAPPAP